MHTGARRVAMFTSVRPGVHIPTKKKEEEEGLEKKKLKEKFINCYKYSWRNETRCLGVYNITGFTRTNLLVLSYIVVNILLFDVSLVQVLIVWCDCRSESDLILRRSPCKFVREMNFKHFLTQMSND